MAIPAISAHSPPLLLPQPPPQRLNGQLIYLRLLNVKVLFSSTAIVYDITKILVLDTLLIRSVYKIIKLLKRLFSFLDEDNSVQIKAIWTDPKARHDALKLAHKCVKVVSGTFDLIARNEISRMTYAALGLGERFQPFSASVIGTFDAIMRPVILLSLANKITCFYLATHDLLALDASATRDMKMSAWIIFAKSSLDVGIEGARFGVLLSGYGSGAYVVTLSLSLLSLTSNSLGLFKHIFCVKAIAEVAPKVQN